MQSAKEGDETYAEQMMVKVLDALLVYQKENKIKNFIPSVETIQDVVENELIASNNF